MIGKTKLQTGGNYEPMPSGKYTLQLLEGDAIKDSYKGVEQDKFKFKFAILDDVKFKDASGKELTTRGRLLWHKFSTYISPKSYLYAFVKIFDPAIATMAVEEREVYDLDSLAGKQIVALVSKEPNKAGDAIYNNIQSFEVCEKELEALDEMVETKVDTTSTTEAVAVPAEAPAEAPKEETAEGFMDSLEKEGKKDAKAVKKVKKEEVVDEQAALEKQLADLKAKKKAGK